MYALLDFINEDTPDGYMDTIGVYMEDGTFITYLMVPSSELAENYDKALDDAGFGGVEWA